MASLTRVINGGILHESFDYGVTPIWSIVANDTGRVLENDLGGIILLHGDGDVSMHTNAPIGDFIFQARIEHEPTSLADIGGLFIQADADSRIECQTYYNGLLGTDQYFEYIKVIRVGDRYSIYASMDGDVWNPMGAALLPDSHQIGFFLRGPEGTGSKNLRVKEVMMYKSNAFVITDVPIGTQIIVKDNEGNTIIERDTVSMGTTESKLIFDLSQTALPIYGASISVIDNGSVIADIINVDIYGGDVYDFTPNVQVLINNVIVDQKTEHYLGNIGGDGQESTLSIINKEDIILTGKKLKVIGYSDYYRGGKFATLALWDQSKAEDYELYEFLDSIELPNMLPEQRVEVIVRIERDASAEAPFFINRYKFRIVLE